MQDFLIGQKLYYQLLFISFGKRLKLNLAALVKMQPMRLLVPNRQVPIIDFSFKLVDTLIDDMLPFQQLGVPFYFLKPLDGEFRIGDSGSGSHGLSLMG